MLESTIHAIERRLWSQETRRRTHPFAWGADCLGGPVEREAARAFLERYAADALAKSEDFYATGPAEWYQLDGDLLTFPSAVQSPHPENNLVYARVSRRAAKRPTGGGRSGRWWCCRSGTRSRRATSTSAGCWRSSASRRCG